MYKNFLRIYFTLLCTDVDCIFLSINQFAEKSRVTAELTAVQSVMEWGWKQILTMTVGVKWKFCRDGLRLEG